jgi:hypothetical protein
MECLDDLMLDYADDDDTEDEREGNNAPTVVPPSGAFDPAAPATT